VYCRLKHALISARNISVVEKTKTDENEQRPEKIKLFFHSK